MKNSQLQFADEHFSRLWNGMQLLQFGIPKHFTTDVLLNQIKIIAEKNDCLQSARIRLSVFRGEGGLYDAVNHFPNYIIEAWPLLAEHDQWNSNGLIMGIYNEAKKSCDLLSNLKHNNYLPSVMAALHAKKEKWNDAIILNSFNRVCESTIANIFLIKDKVIYTPALSEGCVAGVMRKFILEKLKTLEFKVEEKEIDVTFLLDADEVFLTNSINNIRWVQQINNTKYNNTLTQKIYVDVISTIL